MCCSRGSERGFRSATSSGEFAVAFEWNGRRFQFCIRRFQSIGRLFFCNFIILPARQPESHAVSPAPYQILWVRGLRAHTISEPGSNLFKPLRRHFRATPSCRQTRSRRGRDDRNTSVQKTDDRLGCLPRDGGTGTNIERLRNSGKKFVERVGSCAPSDPRVVIVACKRVPNFWSPQ
jgi:hypothetical protein